MFQFNLQIEAAVLIILNPIPKHILSLWPAIFKFIFIIIIIYLFIYFFKSLILLQMVKWTPRILALLVKRFGWTKESTPVIDLLCCNYTIAPHLALLRCWKLSYIMLASSGFLTVNSWFPSISSIQSKKEIHEQTLVMRDYSR